MNKLLALLQRYVPDYQSRIQGVYGWALEELEEAFGRPLPGFYQDFARFMGQQGGPLLAHVHGYNPLEIIDFYQLTPAAYLPPGRFLYVFGDPSMDAHHYWLDLEAPSEEEDCHVVRIPLGKEAWKTRLSPGYVSLREMLFVWAMRHVRLPAFPHEAEYLLDSAGPEAGKSADADELTRLFEKLGFTCLPYPRRCLLFDRDDAGIELYRPPSAPGLSFRVGMRDREEFRRFQGVVEDIRGIKEL
jgi:hypothetical protein